MQFPANRSSVFYNPRMSINRDIAVLFAGSHFPSTKLLHVCDPMTGSGVRTARYLLETPNVAHVIAADKESDAIELARETIRLNGLEGRANVVGNDAHSLLSDYTENRFDIIDLDPFGSPAPFFECALRATAVEGVIAATATDMGPLSGARPTACLRKYGVSTVRTEFEKEIAVRALVSCLIANASRLELGIDIAFSHTTDHYARVYAVLKKGRKAANQSLAKLGYITYCPSCLSRSDTKSISLVQNTCATCSAPTKIGGPFWLGPLWDQPTVESMIRRTPTLNSSRLSDVQKILSIIQEEMDSPRFYYTTDAIASAYAIKPPSIALLIQLLRNDGYKATRTHFNPAGFRTNAPLPTVVASFRKIAEKS